MKRKLIKIGHPDEYMNEKIHTREMAYPPNVIVLKLIQYSDPLLEHLLKLYYFRKSERYIHGWMGAVYKCLIRTYKNNRTNKWPTKRFLYENIWNNAKDAFQEHHNGYLGTFSTFKILPKIDKPDVEGSAAFCESYFKWLSQKLSEKGIVTLPEVEEELTILLRL
jgi:hypothetical protein